MPYFLSEFSQNGIVYSCDKICIMGDIEYHYIEMLSNNFEMFLLGEYSLCKDDVMPWLTTYLLDYKCTTRYGVGEYKNNFNFSLSNDSSFYLGYKHNSNKIGSCSWKIELNPNKCLPCDFFDRLLRFFICRSKYKTLRISQADIAIDFPLPRKNFFLQKDKRIYSTVNDGLDNITEYLSRHNSNGFCKLYNKSVESKLDYDLTRFEITLQDFSKQNVCLVFPEIHYYDYSQIKFDDTLPKLSQNDDVLLELIRLHPDKFQYLSRRKKQLLKPYLSLSAKVYEFDYNTFRKLYDKMVVYFLG